MNIITRIKRWLHQPPTGTPQRIWAGGAFLCLVVVLAGSLLSRPAWTFTLDVGAEPPFIYQGQTATFQNYFLFHRSETMAQRTFRWMGKRGTVTIPAALRMQPLVLDIVACRCNGDEPEATATDAPTELVLNNTPIAMLDTRAQWRNYHVLVPPALSHPDYSVMVDMRAPAWTDPSGREISLAIDTIGLRQPAPPPLADPLSIALVVVAIAGVSVWQRSLVLAALLSGAWAWVLVAYQPQLIPRPALVTVLVVGLIGLWWAAGRLPDATRRVPVAQAVLATALALWLVFSPQVLGPWLIDDAYISFRYALNMVQGHGLVFNPGEYVEGYTNFLWTMIVAAVIALGGDPVVVTCVITMVLAFVLMMLALLLAGRAGAGAWAWVAPLLLAASNPFLLYTTRGSGMETALFATLLLATVLALSHHTWGVAGVLAALTTMTRPDGVLLAGAGGLYLLWTVWQDTQGRGTTRRHTDLVRLVRPLLTYGLVFTGIYGSYFVWRWNYYGYLLPNTFYAKVGNKQEQVVRGLAYLRDFARDDLLLPVAVVAVMVGGWFLWRGRRQRPPDVVLLLVLFVGLFCTYIVLVGGDWMPGARFFLPLIPLLAVCIAWGAARVADVSERLVPVAVLVIVGSVAMLLVVRLPDSSTDHVTPVWQQYYVVRRYREVGRTIKEHTPPGSLIATEVAGALPYYAERPMIDILGLTDEHIAHLPPDEYRIKDVRAGHQKTDPAYVFQREPDVIPYKGSSLLWTHPDFDAYYHSESFDGPEGHWVTLYMRDESSTQR